MKNDHSRIVLVGPNQQAVRALLQDMGISVQPLLRRGVTIISDTAEDVQRLRGMGETPWAPMPDMPMINNRRFEIEATLRLRMGSFHEVLARHLAWRIWHDC